MLPAFRNLYLRLRSPEYREIAENRFGRYSIPRSSSHRPAARTVLAGGVHEEETLSFLLSAAKGDIAHAGAYFGDFLPALSSAYETVWAFEPNPENFSCALKTVELNGLRNVVLKQAALGKENGHASLVVRKLGIALGGASRIGYGGLKVQMVALDDVVKDRFVGAIHLDVERSEEGALMGAVQTILRCRPIIVLETPTDLSSLGYEPVERINANTVYVHRL